jgi:hypothetical protein
VKSYGQKSPSVFKAVAQLGATLPLHKNSIYKFCKFCSFFISTISQKYFSVNQMEITQVNKKFMNDHRKFVTLGKMAKNVPEIEFISIKSYAQKC